LSYHTKPEQGYHVMISIGKSIIDCKDFIKQLKGCLLKRVEQEIEAELTREADQWLRRKPHARRERMRSQQGNGVCQKCGTRQMKAFSRNGYRARQMVTSLGVVHFGLPRVRCECGGSVQVTFKIVQPYQRLWDDVTEQVEKWAEIGVSLRQMQGMLGEQCHTQVGLSTLNRLVQAVDPPIDIPLSSVPPVVMLDAIWVTLLTDTDVIMDDQMGRQRVIKGKRKVCVLVALGLYPQTGRGGILGWSMVDSESQSNWEPFLVALDTRGVYRQRGLELLIHDGGSGLEAALQQVYPHIPQQRCLFHKLRNLRQAIIPPQQLSAPQRRTFKDDLMRQLRPIFQSASLQHARQLTDDFCARFQASQVKLIDCLRQNWDANFAFFRVLARFPTWPRRFLRTTSLLERVNRSIRRLFRSAGAFHSPDGLLATVARVLVPIRFS
jgi:putative transposase